MKLAFCLAAAVALAPALPAHALQIRADREDAEYLELATKYASAVRLPTGHGGVLIKERWILTTAQAAKAIAAAEPRAAVAIGGRSHVVEEAIPHPGWQRPGGPDDVGLILLKEPVKAIAATPVQPGPGESGRTVVLVGFGPGGKAGESPGPADGRKRASINTIDGVGPQGLEVRVKSSDDASDLQGVLVPGDFGGPMYIETPESLTVAGIAYAIDGNTERFARVSAYFGWISDTMLEAATREAALLLGGPGAN